MRNSFTEENFETFVRDSMGRRGGGRNLFGSFSKDISWSTVEAEEFEKEETAVEDVSEDTESRE